MNISIPNDYTSNFTKNAKSELSTQVITLTKKISEEAQKIELDRNEDIDITNVEDMKKFEISVSSVKDATTYVVKHRVEKIRINKYKEILPPLFYTVAGALFSYGCSKEEGDVKTVIIVLSVVVCAIAVIIQMSKFNR